MISATMVCLAYTIKLASWKISRAEVFEDMDSSWDSLGEFKYTHLLNLVSKQYICGERNIFNLADLL